MADFIGSYYECDDFDEEILGEQLDVMNSEQPISVLDMEALKTKDRIGGKESATADSAAGAGNKGEGDAFKGLFSIEQKYSLDDDLDIPVASMSTLDQAAASMVTLPLNSYAGKNVKEEKGQNRVPRQVETAVNEKFTPTSNDYIRCEGPRSKSAHPTISSPSEATHKASSGKSGSDKTFRKSFMRMWGAGRKRL